MRGRRQNGLTLLELLVALAVFVVIAAAAYSGLQTVLTARASTEAVAVRLGRLQLAWQLIERDLEQTVARSIRDEFGQRRPAMEGGALSGDLITLTRAGWDNPLAEPRSGLQRLAYQQQDHRLLRQFWRTLDRGAYSEPQTQVLLNEVLDVGIRFLDSGNSWRNEWPPANTENPDSLPKAVEITLVLSDWGEISRLFLIGGISG